MATLLLTEDEPDQRDLFARMLVEAGHEVLLAADAAAATTILAEHAVDAVVFDPGLPGLADVTALGSIRLYTSAPIVALTARSSDEFAAELIRAGADDVVIKQATSPAALDRAVRLAIERTGQIQHALPHPSAAIVELLDDTLRLLDEQWPLWDVWFVAVPHQGRWTAIGHHGDLSLAPQGRRWDGLPCGEATRTGQVVVRRGDTVTVSTPVPSHRGSPTGVLGAVSTDPDAPVPDRHLLRNTARTVSTLISLDQQRRHAEHKENLARSFAEADPLTGLPNRRAFERAVDIEEARAASLGSPAGVVFLDLDDLKAVNDRDGHAEGDRMLRRAAQLVSASLRADDIAFRIGGDEFAVLAANPADGDLTPLLTRLRASFADAGIPASMGAATRDDGGLRQAVRSADRAMYDDKRSRKSLA